MSVKKYADVKSIIDERAKQFLEDIRAITDKPNRKKKCRTFPDFPIVFSLNDDYYAYSGLVKRIETSVREILVKGFIKDIIESLHSEKYKIYMCDTTRYVSFSNDQLEAYVPIEFIIDDGCSSTGYRFTDYPDEDTLKLMKEYDVDRIEVLLCYSSADSEKALRFVGKDSVKVLGDFLQKFMNKQEYDYYVDSCNMVINESLEAAGYSAIQRLTTNNIYSFKETVLNKLRSEEVFSKLKYRVMRRSNAGNVPKEWSLNEKDYEIIKKNYFDGQRYEALVGNRDFGICFTTAEYMFNTFDNSDHFDYTSVVAGYLKCIELILYHIVLTAMNQGEQDQLRITTYKTKKAAESMGLNPCNINSYVWIPLIPENKKYFKTDLGSLISFLKDDKTKEAGVLLIEDVETFCEILENYKNDCRNEHLHKDIIDNFEQVKIIRENTIILAAVLLGGCKYIVEGKAGEIGIEGYRDFEKMYSALQQLPVSVKRFVIRTKGGETIKAYKRFEQNQTEYNDKTGSIHNSTIQLIRVEDFNETTYDDVHKCYSDNDLLVLSEYNVPESIWVQDRNGKLIPIEW